MSEKGNHYIVLYSTSLQTKINCVVLKNRHWMFALWIIWVGDHQCFRVFLLFYNTYLRSNFPLGLVKFLESWIIMLFFVISYKLLHYFLQILQQFQIFSPVLWRTGAWPRIENLGSFLILKDLLPLTNWASQKLLHMSLPIRLRVFVFPHFILKCIILLDVLLLTIVFLSGLVTWWRCSGGMTCG